MQGRAVTFSGTGGCCRAATQPPCPPAHRPASLRESSISGIFDFAVLTGGRPVPSALQAYGSQLRRDDVRAGADASELGRTSPACPGGAPHRRAGQAPREGVGRICGAPLGGRWRVDLPPLTPPVQEGDCGSATDAVFPAFQRSSVPAFQRSSVPACSLRLRKPRVSGDAVGLVEVAFLVAGEGFEDGAHGEGEEGEGGEEGGA